MIVVCYFISDTYDAVVLVGVILYGHLPCDAFLEMTRLVKSGSTTNSLSLSNQLFNIFNFPLH